MDHYRLQHTQQFCSSENDHLPFSICREALPICMYGRSDDIKKYCCVCNVTAKPELGAHQTIIIVIITRLRMNMHTTDCNRSKQHAHSRPESNIPMDMENGNKHQINQNG